MHRDHSDYKPWQCSHCPTKTAFVKTLYRYIRPNVSLTWPNKYDKFYISALTVLQKLYLLKLFLLPPRVAEVARRAFDKRLDSNKQTKCLSRNICYFFSSIKISRDFLEDFGQKLWYFWLNSVSWARNALFHGHMVYIAYCFELDLQITRKNDAFVAEITNIFMAIFVLAERLPTYATLSPPTNCFEPPSCHNQYSAFFRHLKQIHGVSECPCPRYWRTT